MSFNTPDVPEIEAEKVINAIDKKEKIYLIDVRTPHEYSHGTIKGSVNIPVSEISEDIVKKYPNKNSVIYMFCLSGSRSAQAVNFMVKMGYKNVFSIENGLLAWRAKGFPLIQPL